ncbi:arginine--tRNA ligase [Mycoplasmopsis cynos]|nr:arginine--tRNA ligase [Mycoplasmopsis cynos]
MNLKQKLKDILNDCLIEFNNQKYFDVDLNVSELNYSITEPNIPEESNKNQINYDFSTNLAFILKKFKKVAPIEIANKIKEKLSNNSNIEIISVSAPGFLNFVLNEKLFSSVIKNVLRQGIKYGAGFVETKKINVEYVSANPTGFLHVGHVRGAVFGDSLIRVLKHAGTIKLKQNIILMMQEIKLIFWVNLSLLDIRNYLKLKQKSWGFL